MAKRGSVMVAARWAAQTQFWIRPEDGLVIAMISNMSDFEFGKILISLNGLFTPEIQD
jgi:hypothetical protein